MARSYQTVKAPNSVMIDCSHANSGKIRAVNRQCSTRFSGKSKMEPIAFMR